MKCHRKALLVLGAALLFLQARPAWAMHIAEGILPLGWAALWWAAALPFVAYGLHRLRLLARQDLAVKPLVAFLAAAIFILSAMPIPVPIAGTCSHPAGTGVAAILVGPGISVVITWVVLLIQALFLAHGGISTLGANTMTMGVAGSYAGYLVFRGVRAAGAGLAVAGFAAGLAADWATYAGTSAILASGIRGNAPFLPLLGKLVLAFVPTQLPIGILEGFLTSGAIMLLYRKRPDLLIKMRAIRGGEAAP
ncbi:MAG: energy-coupling factor ABC transporter permease [Desulfobacteraceae bacterium]|nr:energy-coupling factor ABC transporter permease [Desulfobacteraceae bacterium]